MVVSLYEVSFGGIEARYSSTSIQIPMSLALPAEHRDFSYAIFPDTFKELLAATVTKHVQP